MSLLNKACDDILSVVRNHEFGIPTISPKNRLIACPAPEEKYYNLNGVLASRLDELVYLNKLQEMKQLSAAEIEGQYQQMVSEASFDEKSDDEIEKFLIDHSARVKNQALLRDFLPIALPILRAIHIDNSSLTDSEMLIFNNLKKLFSRYNDHPSNIRRLIDEYQQNVELLDEKLKYLANIENLLNNELRERMNQLGLNLEQLRVQQEEKEDSLYPTQLEERTQYLQLALDKLHKQINRITILCDFLPSLVLCHPSNWYNDSSMRELIEKCQEVSEAVLNIQLIKDPKILSLEEILALELENISFG